MSELGTRFVRLAPILVVWVTIRQTASPRTDELPPLLLNLAHATKKNDRTGVLGVSLSGVQAQFQRNGLELGSIFGCVAKTGEWGSGKIAFVLTVPSHRHPSHEPQAPLQVASFSIRHHSVVCAVVPALPAQLPQPGRGDAWSGFNSGPYDRALMGSSLCSRTRQAMPSSSETQERLLAGG